MKSFPLHVNGSPRSAAWFQEICNAIFAATGKRVLDLPLSKQDLSWT